MILPYILIIENDRMNRTTVSNSFQKDGFCIQFVNNAESALKLLIKSRPFLIAIDLIMPKLSANTFNNILKNDEDTSNIKTIAFSDDASGNFYGNFDSFINTKGEEQILINGLKKYLITMTPIPSTIIFLENK